MKNGLTSTTVWRNVDSFLRRYSVKLLLTRCYLCCMLMVYLCCTALALKIEISVAIFKM